MLSLLLNRYQDHVKTDLHRFSADASEESGKSVVSGARAV